MGVGETAVWVGVNVAGSVGLLVTVGVEVGVFVGSGVAVSVGEAGIGCNCP